MFEISSILGENPGILYKVIENFSYLENPMFLGGW